MCNLKSQLFILSNNYNIHTYNCNRPRIIRMLVFWFWFEFTIQFLNCTDKRRCVNILMQNLLISSIWILIILFFSIFHIILGDRCRLRQTWISLHGQKQIPTRVLLIPTLSRNRGFKTDTGQPGKIQLQNRDSFQRWTIWTEWQCLFFSLGVISIHKVVDR